ncbi:MAG: glycosyltransferase family 2 protein [Bacteroidales bacterium]|nr:glycosyltransferase family 2 protein [Bacteroidales bacterium]
MKCISILIPTYNEEVSLPFLYEALISLMDNYTNYNWEILFINDGSTDSTLEIIKKLRTNDDRINYVNLSRNFGKESAMLAGFDYVTGDCAIIMDADLQHPPTVIPQMITYWEEGYEDVYAKRNSRGKESILRKKLSLIYYNLLQKSTRINVLQNVGDFRLLDRRCINALKQLRETQRYTKGLYCWIGYKKKEVIFNQANRTKGKSSFNLWSLLNLAIEGITSFTTAPLRMATIMGFLVSITAFLYLCYIIIKTIFVGEPVQGYPTLITVILFMGGVQLISLGIIGEYIGRIFNETKNRPVYIAESYNETKL